jgi:hypothetical protein
MSDHWIERAQSAEAKLAALSGSTDKLKEKVRTVTETLGARERSNGSFEIDFEKLVANLGPENALEVRRIIDEQYGITGAAGVKPKMKARAA